MAPPPRPAVKRPTPPITTPRPVITAGASPFSDVIDNRTRHGKFLMLYSEAGEGKTTLAAQFPNPAFIVTSGEQGIFLYKERNVVSRDIPIIPLEPLFQHTEIPAGEGHPGWKKCINMLHRFCNNEHSYQTLVIDSTSGLQDLCFQHGASMLFDGDMDGKDFCDYYRGYSKAAEVYWSGEFLPLCLNIVAKGLNVILIAHSTYKPVNNPTGPDYDQYRPALFKSIYEYTKKDLHGIFFIGREVNVAIDQKTKKKQTLGDRRFIGLSPNTYYTAKSWCTPEGVTELDCGESAADTWSVLSKALSM